VCHVTLPPSPLAASTLPQNDVAPAKPHAGFGCGGRVTWHTGVGPGGRGSFLTNFFGQVVFSGILLAQVVLCVKNSVFGSLALFRRFDFAFSSQFFCADKKKLSSQFLQ
jgi:hypothetical protein